MIKKELEAAAADDEDQAEDKRDTGNEKNGLDSPEKSRPNIQP